VQYIDVQWNCTQISLQAAFSVSPNPIDLAQSGTVRFSNTSTGAVSYWWHFGVGNDTSNAANPSYAYTTPGTYTITLVARNYNCTDTARQSLSVLRAEPSALLTGANGLVRAYPNPVSDRLLITASAPLLMRKIAVHNSLGQLLYEAHATNPAEIQVDCRDWSRGFYLVQVWLLSQPEPLWIRVWRE
jgi:PKD repeat protein